MSKTIEDLHWIFGKEKFESFSPDVKAKAIVLYNNDTPGDWDELLKLRYEEPMPSDLLSGEIYGNKDLIWKSISELKKYKYIPRKEEED